jgi:hypothetical protein
MALSVESYLWEKISMTNPEFKAAEHQAIQRNAVEDARLVAEHLSRAANANLAIWLRDSNEIGGAEKQFEKFTYEVSEARAKQALNIYKFLTDQVYS